MKTIGRDKVRGKPLDHDCYRARIVRNQYGLKDHRCFCYGLYDPMYEETLPKCLSCKAFCDNAKPPKED